MDKGGPKAERGYPGHTRGPVHPRKPQPHAWRDIFTIRLLYTDYYIYDYLMNSVFIVAVGVIISYFIRHRGGMVQLAGTSRQTSEHLRITFLTLRSIETTPATIDVRVF